MIQGRKSVPLTERIALYTSCLHTFEPNTYHEGLNTRITAAFWFRDCHSVEELFSLFDQKANIFSSEYFGNKVTILLENSQR